MRNEDKHEILQLAHVDGQTGYHYDFHEMVSRLETRYHWADLKSDAINFIFSCNVCKNSEADISNLRLYSKPESFDMRCLMVPFNGNLVATTPCQLNNNKVFLEKGATTLDFRGKYLSSESLDYTKLFKPAKTKPFVCGLCKKTFGRKDHLRNHQLTHTESRQFSCTIDNCRRTFRRKDRLSEHMINFHNCPKTIFCHICFLTFSSKSLLSKHMNNQHYVYKCSVCKSGFEDYEEMVKHQQIYCKSEISINANAMHIVNEKKKKEVQENISFQKDNTMVNGKIVRLAKVVQLDGGEFTEPSNSLFSAEYSCPTPIWWMLVEAFIKNELNENKENPNFSYEQYLEWGKRQHE